jgi:hypothetical protein
VPTPYKLLPANGLTLLLGHRKADAVTLQAAGNLPGRVARLVSVVACLPPDGVVPPQALDAGRRYPG